MFFKTALLALLVTSTVATPEARCSRDKCYKSVYRAHAASSDCTSFQRAYVTPCAETRTRTITIIQTTTAPTTGTQTITQTSYDSIVKTQTTTLTETFTTTKNHKVSYLARFIPPTSPSCSGLTIKPTATPSYASVCHGTQRYASACSCIGVPPATTTIIPATSTSTVFTVFTSTVGGAPITTTATTTVTTTNTITATQFASTTVTVTAGK